MSDLELARLKVEQFDRVNAERERDGENQYREPSHVTFARALIAVTAERDMLLAAANRVLQWFKTYDSEDAAVLNDLTTVVLQVEKRQAEPPQQGEAK